MVLGNPGTVERDVEEVVVVVVFLVEDVGDNTVTLAGVAYGQTVLARAVAAAGFDWNAEDAHSAVYDAEQTARLFCTIANAWPKPLG